MVYVINKQGQALMPTERFGKVRRLLKNSLAHVVCQRNILQVANKEPYNKNGKIRKQAGGFIWKFAIE